MQFKHSVPIKQIADWTHSEITGNTEALVKGLNEIHNVEEGDITFVDHEKYYDFTLGSKATFIIINKRTEAPEGKTLLYNENPFLAYNSLAQKFHPEIKAAQSIGKTALIGAGTYIYPNTFIGDEVKIGKNCTIHPNVSIYPYSQIGDGVIIHSNTTVGSDAFYYKRQKGHYDKMHTAGRVVIADNVEIGASCTIDAGVSSDTFIGRGTKIDNQVHIGHDVRIGENCIIAGQVGIAGNTTVGNWVTIYGKAAINKNITIGDGAVILATSSVAKSLEAGKTYLGYPAVEARVFARQAAVIKMLPGLWEKLKKL